MKTISETSITTRINCLIEKDKAFAYLLDEIEG